LWAQLAFFGGCAVKTEDSFYAFPDHAFCLDHFSSVIARVGVLGWPLLAAVAFGAGFVCYVVAIRSLKGELADAAARSAMPLSFRTTNAAEATGRNTVSTAS
jgi:hypothetical protein